MVKLPMGTWGWPTGPPARSTPAPWPPRPPVQVYFGDNCPIVYGSGYPRPGKRALCVLYNRPKCNVCSWQWEGTGACTGSCSTSGYSAIATDTYGEELRLMLPGQPHPQHGPSSLMLAAAEDTACQALTPSRSPCMHLSTGDKTTTTCTSGSRVLW